jgi:hypothetical protein
VTPSAFGLALALGAALLALWVLARFAGFGPKTIFWAVVQVAIACLLLTFVLPAGFGLVEARGLPATVYLQVFGVALPLLVYAFLAGGWTARAAIDALR